MIANRKMQTPGTVSRTLIVGVPRSGTTWIARMLSQTDDATLVFEPDNQLMFPFALKAKRRLPGAYYPCPTPEASHVYEELWASAFGARGYAYSNVERLRRLVAGRALRREHERRVRFAFRGTRDASRALRLAEALAVPERPAGPASNVLVKSVYVPLAAEWVAERVGAQVLVVFRDLRNVVSSWLELGWIGPPTDDELMVADPDVLENERRRLDAPPLPSDQPPLARLTWLLSVYTLALKDAARRHPEWHVVCHEEAAADLPGSLQAVASALGLRWSERADAAVAAATRPGRAFEIARLPQTLRYAWKERLTPDQTDEIEEMLGRFSLAGGAEKPHVARSSDT